MVSPLIEDEAQRERLARAIASDLLLYQAERLRGAGSVEEAKRRIADELEEGRALYAGRTGDAGARVDAAFAALLPGFLAMKDGPRAPSGEAASGRVGFGLWAWLAALLALGIGAYLLRTGH